MKLRFLGYRWFQVGLGAFVLFFAAEQALRITDNPNFFPTVILLGSFAIPAAFVAYFYGRERSIDKGLHGSRFPIVAVLVCFLVGGTIGTVVAGILEFETLHSLSIPGLFLVGLIEESAKMILPIVFFLAWRYRSDSDGLLFGVASGMGFAALETMGYGLMAFMNSKGSIGAAEEVVLIRGLLSPVGHAAWTGLVAATLWHEREMTGKLFNWKVVMVFALAVVLHAVWDIGGTASKTGVTYTIYVIVGGTSLALLISRMQRAAHHPPLFTGAGPSLPGA